VRFSFQNNVNRLFLVAVSPGLIMLSVFFSSCKEGQGELDDDVVARVNKEYLYKSDIESIIPVYLAPGDSASIAFNFVEDWAKRQVFVEKAKKNLSGSLTEIERQVEQYRNALIVHAFENQLFQEHLDTVITRKQFSEFYEKVKDNFPLKENIVRARYVKFPVEWKPGPDDFKKLLQSTEDEDLAKLEDYCLHNAISFFLNVDTWLVFSDLLRDLPIEASNPEQFLKNNKLVEVTDELFRYFVFIFDYRLVGSLAPLSFEEENIRNLILIQRKRQLINEKRNQFYNEALDLKNVELMIK